jgi:periplasmic divalent cation tolerance protein
METSQTGGQTLLILTNLPDEASAQALATTLVSAPGGLREHAGALPFGVSLAGRHRKPQEVPLLIKTTAQRYAALEAAIRAAHPYELPEIIAVPIAHGLPEYLAGWMPKPPESPDGKLPA